MPITFGTPRVHLRVLCAINRQSFVKKMAALDDGSDPFAHDITNYTDWYEMSKNIRSSILYTVQSNLLTDSILPSLLKKTPQNIKDYLKQQQNTAETLIQAHNSMLKSFNDLVDADAKIAGSLFKQANSVDRRTEFITWARASAQRQERFSHEIASIKNSIKRIERAAADIASTYK